MSYQSFEDLEVWKRARVLKKEISNLVKGFPDDEKYRLVDQLKRSTRSIGTQISEGHGRQTYPDRIRFCVIARGSLSETLNHLIDALDEDFITEAQMQLFRNKITDVEKVLNGYISYLERKSKEK
ncbi:four helix bundle protein [Niabella sp. 22666]|uniref:four helix bundle protein n=1 Tax=Niabella sp. 22666 TaxID=3453954 RepID=UPI003F832764